MLTVYFSTVHCNWKRSHSLQPTVQNYENPKYGPWIVSWEHEAMEYTYNYSMLTVSETTFMKKNIVNFSEIIIEPL